MGSFLLNNKSMNQLMISVPVISNIMVCKSKAFVLLTNLKKIMYADDTLLIIVRT